jgi:hypothetical protein
VRSLWELSLQLEAPQARTSGVTSGIPWIDERFEAEVGAEML